MEERLENLEISKRMRERVMETHEETMSMVKIEKKYSQVFWTKKGVRQSRQRRRIKRDIETIQKMAEEKKGMEISTEKTKILVFEKRKKGEKLEVERRRTGKSEGNKILRIHIGKKWKCREALSRMKKKGNNSDEENMEHRGKDI
ncbi:hypothetical protein PV326_001828 [Microctonus aethiopoides]|nr:hypothetical protein PV326_001828 [Microctonus aethiopoides]